MVHMSDAPLYGPCRRCEHSFDNYLECLHNASISGKQRRWYVKRVEAFIKAQKGRRIKTLSGDEIGGYFEATGRQKRLTGWQFRQCIDIKKRVGRPNIAYSITIVPELLSTWGKPSICALLARYPW
jgi:hypothetical protein